jgi:hypothetical protein
MHHRRLFYSLVEHLPKKEFSIITGARQTGKYPDFDFQFLWLYPFDEDFFRRDLNF